MGVEPFLITASVNLVLAQRLARKICVDCKQPMKYERKILEDCGFSAEQIANAKLMKGAGCRTCNGSGYKGRVALYEVMRFTTTSRRWCSRGRRRRS
jgi:type IV pilus assembly protein PilB